jgi:decaprenylphospho-beta-D-erythro-pentofuranosid-2-ulose 2-reductase
MVSESTSLKGNVLILGASSDVAAALSAKFAAEKYSLTLAGRDEQKLSIMATDLNIRYRVPVAIVPFDALNFKSHLLFYHSLQVKPDVAICVFGFLGNQAAAENDWAECSTIIDSNYTGAVSVLNVIASEFEKRKHGIIVGISSVAGERGRQSNYIYGSAKAGFTAYLSGLRNRLFKSNVHVLTVKPGFMKTRMIEGLKTPGPLTAKPEAVAEQIYKAVKNRKDSIYVLPIWALIMLIIRMIPEGIFKKMKL